MVKRLSYTPRKNIVSATLVLQSITEQQEHLAELQYLTKQAEAMRDELIRDAAAAGITTASIMATTGLSSTKINKVRQSPRVDPETLTAPFKPKK